MRMDSIDSQAPVNVEMSMNGLELNPQFTNPRIQVDLKEKPLNTRYGEGVRRVSNYLKSKIHNPFSDRSVSNSMHMQHTLDD